MSPKLAVIFSITPFIVGRPVQVLATTTAPLLFLIIATLGSTPPELSWHPVLKYLPTKVL